MSKIPIFIVPCIGEPQNGQMIWRLDPLLRSRMDPTVCINQNRRKESRMKKINKINKTIRSRTSASIAIPSK